VLKNFIDIFYSLLKIFLFTLYIFSTSLLFANDYVEKPLLQKITKKYKQFASKRFLYQQKKFNSVKNSNNMKKLQTVNRFFNTVRYMSDKKVYGKKDYWATPWQFLGKDKGDCEDYVISKYFALRYLNISAKKLFFTYVRSTQFKAPHMVLTYFETPKSEPLILDNNNQKIFPASKRKDLTPIYNFNGEILYKISKKGSSKKIKDSIAHTKWDQLLYNMKRKKI